IGSLNFLGRKAAGVNTVLGHGACDAWIPVRRIPNPVSKRAHLGERRGNVGQLVLDGISVKLQKAIAYDTGQVDGCVHRRRLRPKIGAAIRRTVTKERRVGATIPGGREIELVTGGAAWDIGKFPEPGPMLLGGAD